MSEGKRIPVICSCNFDKLSQYTVWLRYVKSESGDLFSYADLCPHYHDGFRICQLCHLYCCRYIEIHGVPKEHQLITPDINR